MIAAACSLEQRATVGRARPVRYGGPMLRFGVGLVVIWGASVLCGCSLTTESCVRQEMDHLTLGESVLKCTGRLRVRRTGKACGPDHEAVLLENCAWVGSDGKRTWEGPAE